MKKQYVKPVVTVVKMTESHAIMAGSVKLNGFIENDPETKPTESVSYGAIRRRTTPKRKRMASCGLTNLSPTCSSRYRCCGALIMAPPLHPHLL